MTSRTRLSVLLISTPVLVFVLVGGMLGRASAGGDRTFQHLRMFEDVVSLVLNNYVEEVDSSRIMEGAMRGLADGLDADSAYLDPKQLRAVEANEPLPAGEVGLELTRQFYLRVIAARDGSPAARAGLRTGDYIRAIDGRPTRDLSVFEGTRLLRGEPGSTVTLTVIRGNAADPREVPLVREKVSGSFVTSRLIDSTGYVRVAAFRGTAVDDLRRHALELKKNGARSLIVDVRATAEGPLDAGLAAARLFVGNGTLAIKTGREGGARETITAASGDGAIDLPLTVLITTGSSGAAELFTAALSGNGRAQVIGERTLGRAGVQKLVRLPENRGLWLTSARYLTPDGEPIHGKGLTPDVEVEQPDVEFDAAPSASDPILDAAIERLRS